MKITIEPLPDDLNDSTYLDVRWSEAQIAARRERAGEITAKGLEYVTPAETRELKRLNDEMDVLARHVPAGIEHIHDRARGLGAGPGGSSTFYAAIMKAGFHPVTRHKVEVPADAALFKAGKAVTVTGDVGDYFPRSVGVPGLGNDSRYIYPALMQAQLNRLDTSVQYLRQTARTLAATGDMIRTIDQTTAKPESALTVELASTDLKQVAHKVSGVANIVALQPQFRSLIEGELRLGLSEALDAMTNSAITAAAVPMASAGADIAEKIAYAKAAVADAGYNPDTVALSPTEATELDLLNLTLNNSTGTGPLFGLKPRVSKALTLAIVFDSTAFASLYTSPVEFAAFEENDGSTNSSLFRAELNATCVVHRADAACEVWGS